MAENAKQPEALSPIKQAYLAVEAMQARLDEYEARQREPIAIIGLGCRFPGDADNPQAYWERLLEGFDAVGEIPAERQALFDMAALPANARAGAYLRHPVGDFDPQFFGISPREAHGMDPQQRLLLEVVWEALEDAAVDPKGLAGSRAAVFIGVTSGDYNHLVLRSRDANLLDGYYASGIAHSVLSGRISYVLGLQGPSLTLDTACSSGLTALHLSIASLRRHECDLAIVGGVNLMLSSENHISFSRFGMLSSDGRCKAFDAAADGFGRGEGCGVVVLRRLSDARAHRERVQALVLGSGISQDGASGGLTVPNGPAQSEAIRLALQDAGVEAGNVSYVETHGTGTPLGDPIETNALGAVFAAGRPDGRPLLIGSVKANIGHLEAAAGLAGLIKLALSLQHRTLPAHQLFSGKSRLIDWERLGLDIPTQTSDWEPIDGRWIAGLSSFGFSGTNVHVVVEAAQDDARFASNTPNERPVQLLTLSAQQDAALNEAAIRLRDHLRRNHHEKLADIAFTRAAGRAHFDRRLAIVATSRQEALDTLSGFIDGVPAESLSLTPGGEVGQDRARIAFLFSGQGSQYTGMGKQLYDASPVFRSALERCAAGLETELDLPLIDLLFDESHATRLHHTAYTQPALFALEWSLAELWRSWGITPGAVMGHSVGEYTAASLAGVFSLEDGLRLIAARGRLFGALADGGGMAAVLAPEAVVAPVVAQYSDVLTIAGLNAPDNTVISGDVRALSAAVAAIKAAGFETRPLNVSHAFHSPLLNPALDGLEQAAAAVSLHAPKLRLISNLTGDKADPQMVTQPAYWREHARRPVRFAAGIETLNRMGMGLWIEIGPGKTLAGLARRCLPAGNQRGNIFASILPGQDEWKCMLEALAGVYVRGATVDWEGFDRDYDRRRLPLPAYPFQRSRFWISPRRRNIATLGGADYQVHPLLGSQVASPLAAMQFTQIFRVGNLAYFDDHCFAGKLLLPGAAMIEALLAAGALRFGSPQAVLSDVILARPLTLEDGQERQAQTVVEPPNTSGAARTQMFSRLHEADEWRLHAEAWVSPASVLFAPAARVDLAGLRARCVQAISSEQHYQRLNDAGLDFGPSLHGVESIYRGDGEALAYVRLPEPADSEIYGLHPALFDAAVQVSTWVLPAGGPARLPFSIERISLFHPGFQAAWSWVQTRHIVSGDPVVDVRLLDDGGEILVEALGIVFRSAEGAATGGHTTDQGLYQLDWVPLADDERLEGISPATQVEAIAPMFDDLAQREHLGDYEQELARLEGLSNALIFRALRELGWQPAPGERVTVDELMSRLGILPRYRQLTRRFLAILAEDGYLQPDDKGGWIAASFPANDAGWLSAVAVELCSPENAVHLEAKIVVRCGMALADVLRGHADPLALLFPGGDLSDAQALYQDSPPARVYNQALRRAVEMALADVPMGQTLRVLEVGAGTGSASAYLLPALQGKCREYLFTDLSPLFLARAQHKFAAYPFMRTTIFDLDKDPAAQGLDLGAFDLIVAANVVHATVDLRQSLARLRSLLAPDGRLMLLEVTSPQRWIDITFGLTDGWWRFADRDLRPIYPLLTAVGWEDLLGASGFEAAVCPALSPVQAANSLILARMTGPAGLKPGTWLILADEPGESGAHLAQAVTLAGGHAVMVRAGDRFERCAESEYVVRPRERGDFDRLLGETIHGSNLPISGAVFLWGLGNDLSESTSSTDLAAFVGILCGGLLHLTQALLAAPLPSTPRLLVATRLARRAAGEAGPFALAMAPLWGLVLTLAREHPELAASLVDFDSLEVPLLTQQLIREMAQPSGETLIARRGAERLTARLVEASIQAAAAPIVFRRLDISERGRLDNLQLLPFEPAPPKAGEVSIRVRAAGLNFKDVLKAMGVVSEEPMRLGSECTGTVVAVGSGVTALQVGDEVVALAPGAFASVVNTQAQLTVLKPSGLAWEAAAASPVVFITAVYALRMQAALKPGERVLIHAAAGGVGLAAVQIARQAGAEVYATAGSDAKRRYLRSLGVRHVFSSRSPDFASKILEITQGEGVDVVLNSLTGEMIPASLSVLAKGGRFIEIGKTGLLTAEEAARLGEQRQYIPVDWTDTANLEPEIIRDLLLELLDDLAAGRLTPLPVRSFDFENSIDAFRFMAAARHTGKLVLAFPPSGDEALIRSDGAYLITGGLGGLGLRLAGWLAEAGASCIVLVNRSPAGLEEAESLQTLREQGAMVVLETYDVADEARLGALFTRFGKDLPELRGVFHLAGVLDKASILNLKLEQVENVLRPKMLGAWNLHCLSAGQPLDFFVLFSSVAAVFGAPGQANHAAANAFLDALAHLRRSQGLPGLSINWGAWAEVGAAASAAAEMDFQGMRWIQPEDGLNWLDGMLRSSAAQIVASPIDWPRFIERFPNRQAPPFFRDVAVRQAHQVKPSRPAIHAQPPHTDQTPVATSDTSLATLASQPSARLRKQLAETVTAKVRDVLGLEAHRPVGERKPLSEMGLDSLMAVELRNRLGQDLRLDRPLPATLVFDYPTVESITDYLVDLAQAFRQIEPVKVGQVEPGDEPLVPPAAGDNLDALLDALEDLSDEDVDRLLDSKRAGGAL